MLLRQESVSLRETADKGARLVDYLTFFDKQEKDVEKLLFELTTPKQYILFSALCCERLEPVFRAASHVDGIKNDQTLRCLDRIWLFLNDTDIETAIWQKDLNYLESFWDEPAGRDGNFWHSTRDEYVESVYHTIKLCQQNTIDHELVNKIRESPTNAITDYIQGFACISESYPDDEYTERMYEWTFTSPLIGLELKKQMFDLEKIISIGNNFAEHMDEIRRFNQTVGINPFALGIYFDDVKI